MSYETSKYFNSDNDFYLLSATQSFSMCLWANFDLSVRASAEFNFGPVGRKAGKQAGLSESIWQQSVSMGFMGRWGCCSLYAPGWWPQNWELSYTSTNIISPTEHVPLYSWAPQEKPKISCLLFSGKGKMTTWFKWRLIPQSLWQENKISPVQMNKGGQEEVWRKPFITRGD